MPARIVLEVNLDLEGKTLAEAEAELMGKLRVSLAPAFQAELARVGSDIQPGVCSACGKGRRRAKEKRIVVGLFGRMELERHRADCRRCGHNAYPADEALGLGRERYSLGVTEASLWLATERKSTASMEHLLRVDISHGQVHRLAQKEGSCSRERGKSGASKCTGRVTGSS